MGENSKKIKEYTRQLESLSKALIDYKIDENFFKKSVYRKLGMVYAHHVEIDKNIPLTIFRSRKAIEIKNEEDLQIIRPLFIGRVEKSIIEWYKISVIVDLTNIHIVGVMHNGERKTRQKCLIIEIYNGPTGSRCR